MNSPNSGGLALINRPARALTGWLDPSQIELFFAGPDLAEVRKKVAAARSAVTQRLSDTNQEGAVTDIPASLGPYIADLRANSTLAPLFAGGADVKIVDLAKLFAAQPFIFTDHAKERIGEVAPDNLPALAAITVPLPRATPLTGNYDFVRQAYVFTSPDPNLKIIGNWSREEGGLALFGFAVGVLNSLVNVGRFRGRLFLRDGYHRAFGLLERGIHRVPAVVQDFATFEHLGLPQGMLPQDAYLGDRPPRLRDYLDDEVSLATTRTATQKVVIVQAIELNAAR